MSNGVYKRNPAIAGLRAGGGKPYRCPFYTRLVK
jgi:hypothetical protein